MCVEKDSTCSNCQKENQMIYWWCCLKECGEHVSCAGCDKGIYLKKE